MTHRIIPRAEWGARYADGAGARKLPCQQTWLHHSVTLAPDLLPPFDDDHAAVRELEKIGQSRFKRGISYTFLVTPAGLIFEGHSIDRVGSHTSGRNTIAAGICLIGNYDTSPPPSSMLDAVGWLLAHGYLSGWWDAVPLDGGHRDTKPTACPGRFAYADLENINGRAKALASAAASMPPQEDDMPPAPSAPVYDGAGNRWVFVRGTNGRLYGLVGGEQHDFGGQITSGPNASVHGTDIEVTARGTDGATWLYVIRGGARVALESLGGRS